MNLIRSKQMFWKYNEKISNIKFRFIRNTAYKSQQGYEFLTPLVNISHVSN